MIVSVLQKSTSVTEAGIAHTEREIALLREYRTRLIADVVTGKLDVRAAAAALPQEPAADEPFEEYDALDEVDEAIENEGEAAAEEADA